jgi:putative endonuclease
VKAPAEWSVYVARCADGSLYTGIAKDVRARLAAHNAGRGAAYTRPRRPLKLVHREDGFTHGKALSREARIKSLARAEKLALVARARALRRADAAKTPTRR